MDRDRERWALPVVAALTCMVAVAAVAANLNAIPLTADTTSLSNYISGFSSFIFPTTAGLWLIVLAALLLQRRKGTRRVRNDEPRGRMSALGIMVLLGIIIIVAVLAQTNVIDQEVPEAGDAPDAATEQDPVYPEPAAGASFDPLTLVPLIAILAVVAWFGYRRLRAGRDSVFASMDVRPGEEEKVERIMAAVSSGSDVRSAIIEAYRQMYGLVQATLAGKEILTPRELEIELTGTLGWPAAPVRSLTRTFEEARYSDHPLAEEHRASALRDLELLRAGLEARS